MKYMFLIYNEEATEAQMAPPEFQEMMEEYYAFTDEVHAKGILDRAAPLEGTETATTVRVRSGGVTTTDGPFAETKEQLGGFYILECANLDEALDYAARIPGARFGCVEVRPVRLVPMPSD